MNGIVVPVAPIRRYQVQVPTAGTSTLFLGDRTYDSTGCRTGTLIVRQSAISGPTGASITVQARNASVTDEEPSTLFLDHGVLASVIVSVGDAQEQLYTCPIAFPPAAEIAVQAIVNTGGVAGAIDATLAIDLQLEEHADFSPQKIPGLVGWWSADYGVTASSGTASAWASRDIAGAASMGALTQATPADQPAVGATINGLPVLTSSGGAINMATSVGLPGVFMIFVVSRLNTLPGVYSAIVSAGNSPTDSTSPKFILQARSSGNDWFFLDESLSYLDTGVLTATGTLQCWAYSSANNDQHVYLNNAQVVTGANPTAGNNASFYAFSGYLTGAACDIGEIAIFNRVLSAAEQNVVYGYLRNRWGLP